MLLLFGYFLKSQTLTFERSEQHTISDDRRRTLLNIILFYSNGTVRELCLKISNNESLMNGYIHETKIYREFISHDALHITKFIGDSTERSDNDNELIISNLNTTLPVITINVNRRNREYFYFAMESFVNTSYDIAITIIDINNIPTKKKIVSTILTIIGELNQLYGFFSWRFEI